MSGNIRKSGLHNDPERHASFLDSTISEAYELDLPPVPMGLSREGYSTRYQPPPQRLPLKAQSPVYTNVSRSLGLGFEDTLSPTELSTIVEVEDRLSSDDNTSISSNDREDMSHLNINDGAEKTANEVPENQSYTELHRSTISDPSVYDIPVYNSSTKDFDDSERSYVRASPELQDHQTSYVKMDSKSSDAKEHPATWVRRTFRRTFRYRYRMEMVDMKKCCGTGSHSGAKKFFILAGVILLTTVVALVGVTIGTSGWILMRKRANMIEGELNTYTTSLRYCRVGRNWTSVTVDGSSKSLSYLLSGETLDIPLNNLTQVTLQRDTVSLGAKQLLLYVVIRSNMRSNASYDDAMTTPSYVNVALWTRSEGSALRQFRQYMAILNDLGTLQIVSRSFWFPLLETDNHFYVRAELMGYELDEELIPLNFTVYLAGHC